ncbi:phosphatase PAP2 family protein [Waterburya agarophytonicola K14]|uniref:Phosphatase PAP2 family protein n=1 Tax=Waterburya agarophytonicola KI4 TaxID=2874699 RepID=A0A964FH90_9CYAN|nr:phosphatase PAP2 family protein [Waterburya agarophytonicola]MCC0178842.1 phosphatase PAP2 family protein [Waterburya agarophytonicola KI4]
MQKWLYRLTKFWRRKVHPQLSTLIATVGVTGLLSCLLIIYVLGKLSNEVLEKEAFAFDQTILLWIHSFANPTLDRIMLWVTNLGNPSTVVVIVTISLALLLWRKYYQEAKIFLVDCLGGVILSYGLKLVFSKTRPDLWQSPITETSYSYPSGHALGSTILYGFLAYLLATRYPKFSWLIYAVAGLLIFAIGLSRLYLGVHWPTDIIGGYCIGFLWVVLCITMLRLHKH